jgi:adenylate kinase
MTVTVLTSVTHGGKSKIAEIVYSAYGVPFIESNTLLKTTKSSAPEPQVQSGDGHWQKKYALFHVALQEYAAQLHGKSAILVVSSQLQAVLHRSYYPLQLTELASAEIRAIVTLIAPPAQILSRMNRDATRQQAEPNLNWIELDQEQFLVNALLIAEQLKIDAFAISNPDGEQRQAAEALYEIVK